MTVYSPFDLLPWVRDKMPDDDLDDADRAKVAVWLFGAGEDAGLVAGDNWRKWLAEMESHVDACYEIVQGGMPP